MSNPHLNSLYRNLYYIEGLRQFKPYGEDDNYSYDTPREISQSFLGDTQEEYKHYFLYSYILWALRNSSPIDRLKGFINTLLSIYPILEYSSLTVANLHSLAMYFQITSGYIIAPQPVLSLDLIEELDESRPTPRNLDFVVLKHIHATERSTNLKSLVFFDHIFVKVQEQGLFDLVVGLNQIKDVFYKTLKKGDKRFVIYVEGVDLWFFEYYHEVPIPDTTTYPQSAGIMGFSLLLPLSIYKGIPQDKSFCQHVEDNSLVCFSSYNDEDNHPHSRMIFIDEVLMYMRSYTPQGVLLECNRDNECICVQTSQGLDYEFFGVTLTLEPPPVIT